MAMRAPVPPRQGLAEAMDPKASLRAKTLRPQRHTKCLTRPMRWSPTGKAALRDLQLLLIWLRAQAWQDLSAPGQRGLITPSRASSWAQRRQLTLIRARFLRGGGTARGTGWSSTCRTPCGAQRFGFKLHRRAASEVPMSRVRASDPG